MNNFLLFGTIGAPEIIIIAFLILLVFGGKKIPELMKGIGKGVKSFKEGVKGIEEDIKSPQEGEKDKKSE
ncbi:MAG: twin-arginine translocase TatA/TatE family subunit [Bacteroidales bacterium]|nr:twin-arginine translocase TatA/TatE family subunit [Bacteroidales bacterium]MDD2424523.1 twin-arginine translocase TatA/TatE family subunit [Bacteroidales bacterium]MDD3988495.1 twin-arginine translocase TatA/TatE family subunit [Bacteroidales bacterium]MDD4639136.1 twin-arginine translocase TatA/TatE family subunit [Bacteroidales bacterium]